MLVLMMGSLVFCSWSYLVLVLRGMDRVRAVQRARRLGFGGLVYGTTVPVGPEVSVEDLLRWVRLVPEVEVELGAGVSSMRRKESGWSEQAPGESVVGIPDLKR